MAFVKVYAVDFANFNLQPHVNTKGWRNLIHWPSSPGDQSDSHGLTARVTRDGSSPGVGAMNNFYIPFSEHDALSLNSRILLRVDFDLPRGERLPDQPTKAPEPWAVALCVSCVEGIEDPTKMAIVSCQFHRTLNGVRVNTPNDLQNDKSILTGFTTGL
jgi:hypothetical protein